MIFFFCLSKIRCQKGLDLWCTYFSLVCPIPPPTKFVVTWKEWGNQGLQFSSIDQATEDIQDYIRGLLQNQPPGVQACSHTVVEQNK